MPSPAERTLCVYGDSHLACIKAALGESRVDADGVRIEFWGAAGPLFRDIHWADGRMAPITDAARDMVETVNGQGRTSVGAGDFDAFLFVGSRLRSHEFVVPVLRGLNDDARFVSRAVAERMLDRWLNGTRSYRAAKAFAGTDGPRVFFAPAPFLTDNIADEAEVAAAVNETATAADRSALWDMIAAAMAADGVELLRQPEDTVTRGGLTRADYATPDAVETRDAVHKNGAYGALILAEALDRLRTGRSAQAAA